MKSDYELANIFEHELFEMIRNHELTIEEFISWMYLHDKELKFSSYYEGVKHGRIEEKYGYII